MIVRANGVHKTGVGWVRAGGVWKKGVAAWVRNGGVWKSMTYSLDQVFKSTWRLVDRHTVAGKGQITKKGVDLRQVANSSLFGATSMYMQRYDSDTVNHPHTFIFSTESREVGPNSAIHETVKLFNANLLYLQYKDTPQKFQRDMFNWYAQYTPSAVGKSKMSIIENATLSLGKSDPRLIAWWTLWDTLASKNPDLLMTRIAGTTKIDHTFRRNSAGTANPDGTQNVSYISSVRSYIREIEVISDTDGPRAEVKVSLLDPKTIEDFLRAYSDGKIAFTFKNDDDVSVLLNSTVLREGTWDDRGTISFVVRDAKFQRDLLQLMTTAVNDNSNTSVEVLDTRTGLDSYLIPTKVGSAWGFKSGLQGFLQGGTFQSSEIRELWTDGNNFTMKLDKVLGLSRPLVLTFNGGMELEFTKSFTNPLLYTTTDLAQAAKATILSEFKNVTVGRLPYLFKIKQV